MMKPLATTVGVALVAAGLAMSTPCFSQSGESAQGDAITVLAPRSVPLPTPRSDHTGASIVTTTVSIPVFHDDLDLERPHDAERLMSRIDNVARDACRQLDRLLPANPDPDCFAKASASGAEAGRAAIAWARGKR
jgi:UrcA family protein